MIDWQNERETFYKKRKAENRLITIQRIIGSVLIAFTVIFCMESPEDATVMIILVPLGLYLLFTDEILLGRRE